MCDESNDHSRCKCFSPHIPGQTFLRFDFSKHPYAYGRERVPRERERERERVTEIERVTDKSVCACVKETWTTHDKSREKACLMQTYHTCIIDSRSKVRR